MLGLGGLLGSGRSETAKALTGALPLDGGEITVDGKRVGRPTPAAAIRAGISMLPEDRKAEGIVPGLSVRENIVLAAMPRLSRVGIVSRAQQDRIVEIFMKRLRIKASGPEQKVGELSGGNQQKVLLARWLCLEPKVLLLDEPTRGIDVGAKAEVQSLIDELAREGLAVLLISSDIEELIEGADRIVVLRGGAVAGELSGDEVDESRLLEVLADHTPSPVLADHSPGPVPMPARPARRPPTPHPAPRPPTVRPTPRPVTTRPDPAGRPRLKPGGPPMTTEATLPRPAKPLARLRDPAWYQEYGVYAAVAVVLLFNVLFTEHFMTADNLRTQLVQVAPIVIVALGMALVIGTEGIDLSVGSTMALAAALLPLYLGYGLVPALLIALLAGAVVGAVNGTLVSLVGLQPIVATLALFVGGRGLALVMADGQLKQIVNPDLLALGTGSFLGVPTVVLIAGVLALAVAFLVQRTTFGLSRSSPSAATARPPPCPGCPSSAS